MKVASGGTGFVNSAGTAGPIRTGDGSFDAPERRNDDGGGHMAPREPFEKCCVRATAQTGSGREPKLSGQKRLGLNCVSLGESAPRGQYCAPRGNFIVFSPLPSSSDTLGPRDPKFGTPVHVSKGYPNMRNLGGHKNEGVKIYDSWIFLFIFLSFFIIRPKMLKLTFKKIKILIP